MLFYSVQPLNPVAIEIFGWPIYWYGLIIMLGGLLAFLLANHEAKRRGLHSELLLDLLIWAVPISIVSARLYYVLFRLDYYLENPGQIIAIWKAVSPFTVLSSVPLLQPSSSRRNEEYRFGNLPILPRQVSF